MSQKAYFVFVAAALWALPAPRAAPPPRWRRNKENASISLAEILSRMDEAGRHLKTLSANLEYTSVTVLVNDRSTESGKLYFRNSRSPEIRIDFIAPAKRILFRKNKGEVYQPSINQVQEFDLSNHADMVQQFLLLGFGSNTDELKKHYDIKFQKEEAQDGNETALLELTPRDSTVARQLSKIDLWINEESWVPVQQQFFETSGDYMIAKYTDIKINRPLSYSRFRIQAKGAKIVKME